jgi:flagella basal body P-ring formation protein FlgA
MPRPLAFIAVVLAVAFAGDAARAAGYRPSVTVDGEIVTVGDLFDGAGGSAAQAVAQAPAPGHRVIFDARALASIAQAFGVDWRPASPHDRSVVERSAVVVGRDRIESLVENALAKQGLSGSFTVVFDQRQNQLALPKGVGELAVESLSYDEEQKRFSGTLTAPGPDGPVAIPVSGVTAELIKIPVLSRLLKEGEIVSAGDLSLAPMRADRIARDTLANPEDIVGRVAERALQPGRALRRNDLKRDLVVKRGQTVTLTFDDGSMVLSLQARALTDGAKGEPVKAINLSSSRVVEGVAAGPGLVAVYDNATIVRAAPAPLAFTQTPTGEPR